MHALHGNGRGRRGGGAGRPADPPPRHAGASASEPWQTVGQALSASELMEQQTIGRLRAAGWKLPPELADDHLLRVYDARLESGWMAQVLPEMGLNAGKVFIIGGDLLTAPHKDDAAAMQVRQLVRWGPDDATPYHLVVPPRPHVEKLLLRAQTQLPLECPRSWVSVAVIVPRESCPESWTLAGMRRALPQAIPVLEDPSLEVRVVAIGERAHVVRVPADVKELPPPRWESGLLARDRVLVFINFRQHVGADRPPPSAFWLRGPPPPVPREELELLRLEYVLPPATKAESGERALRAAVRKVSMLLGLAAGPPLQLRQVQPAHGVMYALLGVPPATARRWLWCSGHGGLFVRPFWTAATSAALARDKFELVWVKGTLDSASRLWDALNAIPGFFGLFADGKDLAIRVAPGTDRAALQTQVDFVLCAPTTLKASVPGVRWWMLAPVREDELWRLQELIASTGLRPARAEFRLAEWGYFRKKVYFPASGTPLRVSLDDGGWCSSEAKLFPADPPPRRKPTAALTPQSTWGGPRPVAATTVSQPSPTPAAAPAFAAPLVPGSFLTPASPATPSVWASVDARQAGVPVALPSLAAAGGFQTISPAEFPELPSGSGGGGRGSRRDRRNGTAVASGAPREADSLEALVAGLQSTLAAIQEELRESRKENALLRQQLDYIRGVRSHQPYALPPLPDPPPVFTPPRPTSELLTRTADQLTPSRPGAPDLADNVGDQVMSGSPQVAVVESKRARRTLQVPSGDAAMVSPDAVSASSSSTPLGAVPPHVE